MDPLYLRNATAQEHDRVEGTLPLMGEDLDRETYITVLRGFYGFVKGWENWAAQHALGDVLNELGQRQRSRMLERDLSFFGETLPDAMYHPDLPPHPASVVGSMYVLEGSTLGGQFIAAHVEGVLNLERGEGNAFFVGYAEQTGPMWKRFKGVLTSVPESDAEEVVRAAKQTFSDFGTWMTAAQSSSPMHSQGTPGQDLHG